MSPEVAGRTTQGEGQGHSVFHGEAGRTDAIAPKSLSRRWGREGDAPMTERMLRFVRYTPITR